MERQRRGRRRGVVERRALLRRSLQAAGGVGLALTGAPALVLSETRGPILPSGVASGDVTADRAVIWSRCDRPARMVVEWSHDASGAELFGVDLDPEGVREG